MPFDLDAARKHCQGLRTLIVLNPGGSRNEELFAKLRARRRAAAAIIDDETCRQHLKAVERYGRELYSDDGHRTWGQLGLPGAAVLRLHMLGELDACDGRLVELAAGPAAPPGLEDKKRHSHAP
jgi:hypothetical protein